MRRLTLVGAAALVVWCIAIAHGAPKVDTVVDNLDNPCGIAVQPGTGHLFVSDSGCGRISRVVDGKVEHVIVGFPLDVYGKGPMYNIGPLGLVFLDKDTLVVGGGGNKDGDELLRVYTVPAAGQDPIKADQMVTSSKLPPTGEIKGEGNFYALVATKTAIFATSNGDDTKGWVARAKISGTKVEKIERFLSTKEAVEVDAPVGATISPRGELVIGQMGEINIPKDSLLSFYNAKTGKLLLNQQTGLFDITALAYSRNTGQLYATDFAWMTRDPKSGINKEAGLFQLIKGDGQSVQTKKIVSLDKPTAMVFGNDGALYITLIGSAQEGDEKKPGKLVRIAPGL